MVKERKTASSAWLILIIGLAITSLAVWSLFFGTEKQEFRVTFYSVGQGDAALIQTKSGYNILVDGGPNNKVVDQLNRDLPINDRELDLVILTHPQADHLYGLIQVLKKFEVKKVLTSNVTHDTALYKQWVDTLNNTQTPIEYVSSGQTITTSDGVTIQFIWPESSEQLAVEDLNAASIVFKLSYNDLDILMTGDADSQTQPYKTAIGEVEVLKVPHHGSKSAMTDPFINSISPEVSVISVGENNRYDHPRAEPLDQLSNVGSKIYRTDQNGNIKIVSDGQKWYTQTER